MRITLEPLSGTLGSITDMFGCGGDQENRRLPQSLLKLVFTLTMLLSTLSMCLENVNSGLHPASVCARRVYVGSLGDANNITLTLLAFAISVYGVGM